MTSEQPPVSATEASTVHDAHHSERRKKRRHSRQHRRYKTFRLLARFLLYGLFLVLMLLIWHQLATWTV